MTAPHGISSSLYADFLSEHLRLNEPLEPSPHALHALSIYSLTPRGTRLGLKTRAVGSCVQTTVESSLVCESQLNPVTTSRLCVTSSRHLSLQARLQASETLRLTLEAQESATEKVPLSFARIGADIKTAIGFAGVQIDAVNGPTLQATMRTRVGAFALGWIAAYDVGLDRSDQRGRVTTLNVATSYMQDDVSAVLQVTDSGRSVQLDLTQTVSPDLIMSSRFKCDSRKDTRSLRVLGKYALNKTETVSSSIGSDGIWIGAFEWRTSKHLKTRVAAQMDLRHYDSDSHHLGVSVEIS
uniref:Uncharacterized protein n=1 Tax=Hyaloperonospora arabidopsidis (strain Emoy2) TaxID=559515 RepID=M4B333_HYAAE